MVHSVEPKTLINHRLTTTYVLRCAVPVVRCQVSSVPTMSSWQNGHVHCGWKVDEGGSMVVTVARIVFYPIICTSCVRVCMSVHENT